MTKLIAETRSVRMLSFFAYLEWAMLVLMPIYALICIVLFQVARSCLDLLAFLATCGRLRKSRQ